MEPQRELRDRASTQPIAFRDGEFLLPEGAGLGVEPNLEFLADYPYRPQPPTERGEALYR